MNRVKLPSILVVLVAIHFWANGLLAQTVFGTEGPVSRGANLVSFEETIEPQSTPWHVLRDYFENGELAHVDDIIGVTAGRCVGSEQKHRLIAGVLVGKRYMNESDGGPLFPPEEYYQYFPVVNHQVPVNYFDNYTPQIRQSVDSAVRGFEPNFSRIQIEGNDLRIYANGNGVAYSIRKNGNYIVLESKVNGYVAGYCYYYLPVDGDE